jgi:Domain of unknown function (DUF4136)
MKVMMLALFGLLVYSQSDAIGKVESSFDKKANFAELHTYSWSGGARAYNDEAHRLVVAAFEKEMTALGFKQVTSGADVTLSYYNVTSTDVDLKKLDEATRAGTATPTKMRARMMVVMRAPATRAEIWTAITREYVEPDQLAATVQRVAERLFATYPGKKPR